MRGTVNNQELTAHVPVVLLQHLREAPDALVRSLDASVLFADVSGFTRLSEKLARRGKEGAERLTDVINACFTALLAEAYENGASLIKFGGDAMLLWFDGDDHSGRACTAAVAMRKALRELVRSETGPDKVKLRMSIGIHSGRYDTFLVGGSHHEYLIAGPAASRAVEMEAIADASQIVVSNETADLLPAPCLGSEAGPGRLLSRSPMSPGQPRRELPQAPVELVASCLSTELRAHLFAAPAAPEHRTATIAFIQFGSFDQLIADEGVRVAAQRLDELVRTVQEAADHYEVCFLGSDIAANGGKLLLSAGAPRVVGDDEERILLALRQVIDATPKLPIRVGVNRGPVFAGEVGPFYRRTYTVMGDAVNLTARLMAKAPWRGMYATPAVLDRSQTRFETEAVPPFMVKGKSRPVQALLVGEAQRAAPPGPTPKPLPLLGREQELAAVRHAVTAARDGSGGLVELVGESGSGKSRLLTEAREPAGGLGVVHTICENYRRITLRRLARHPATVARIALG
jgi:class 3 adenylate cyclase